MDISCRGGFTDLRGICYLWIWHSPERFRAWCANTALRSVAAEPVDVLQLLFWLFKVLQCAVFVGWCFIYGDGSLWPASPALFNLGLGAALMAAGQALNVSVFHRLGKIGVFYGNKLGYRIPWSRKFPKASPVCWRIADDLGFLLSDALSVRRLVFTSSS